MGSDRLLCIVCGEFVRKMTIKALDPHCERCDSVRETAADYVTYDKGFKHLRHLVREEEKRRAEEHQVL